MLFTFQPQFCRYLSSFQPHKELKKLKVLNRKQPTLFCLFIFQITHCEQSIYMHIYEVIFIRLNNTEFNLIHTQIYVHFCSQRSTHSVFFLLLNPMATPLLFYIKAKIFTTISRSDEFGCVSPACYSCQRRCQHQLLWIFCPVDSALESWQGCGDNQIT
jgi:hypothetical protein